MGTGTKCGGCSLEHVGKGFTAIEIGKRYEQNRCLFIGEASGKSELQDGLPFRNYGQSGSLLADAMRDSGIDRGDVAITNIVRCMPPGGILEGQWFTYSSINQCISNYLIDVIQELKPRIILAIGGTALRVLTREIKGKAGTLDHIHGYVLPGAGAAEGIPVIGTYHPSGLRRGSPELYPLLQRDVRKAFLIAQGRLQEDTHYILDPLKHKGRYQTAPSVAEAWEWFRSIDSTRTIYCDIETPRSTREDESERTSFADRDINLIQFTQRRGEGIALPWRDEFIEVATAILATPNRKCWHNGFGFDLPVLEANGVIPNGEQDDTMVMWKHYQPDLPANLGAVAQYCGYPFAWKSLSDSEPELYGCLDVDADCWIDETLTSFLTKENRMDSYKRYFQRFYPILRKTSAIGISIGSVERANLERMIRWGQGSVDKEIKGLVPEAVLGAKHAKGGYKSPPLLKCSSCKERFRVDHFCNQEQLDENEELITVNVFVPYADLAEENGLVLREVVIKENEKCRCNKKTRSGCDVCAGSGIIPKGLVEQRWTALTEFNPNSSAQVKRFIRFLGHPVPKHAKRVTADGEAAETTEEKELMRLYEKTKHPIYLLLRKKRQLTKMQGTYVKGYAPDKDGKIHTTFTFAPATWQLSSKAPNIQNSPARGKSRFQQNLVNRFNRMLVASEGCMLVNFDYKSFHGQTTACEAGLPDYLRLAKIDIHSFNACHFIKHPERHNLLSRSDADLKAFFGELKKDKRKWTNGLTFKQIRDSKTKSAGLGIGFGMQAAKLYKLYQEDFDSKKEAEAIWNLIMVELFPGLYKWQQRVRRIASKYDERFNPEGQGFLLSRFGAIRRFVDVQRYDRNRGKWVPGDQGEAAIAFLPASNAFGMIRETMLQMDEKGILNKFRLCNTTHDSLKFDCPIEFVEECVATVPAFMEAPCPMMVYEGITGPEGLSVEVESQVGKSVYDLH